MRYTILSDIPGRLSIRCGAHLITDDEARGIAVGLLALDGVAHADVHGANGRILVLLADGAHDAVLDYIASLDVLDLPSLPEDSMLVPASVATSMENNRFMLEAVSKVFWHLARRILLPAPVRIAITVIQSVPFIVKGLRQLAKGKLTVEVLDATAIVVSVLRGSFKDASTVMLLLRLTEAMERHVQRRVRIAISENLIARPETVWLADGDHDVSISIAEVREGQVLHMGMGQVLPVDGTVTSGCGEVNEASLTGEPDLVRKEAGDSVFAGTALESGDLYVEVTAAPGRSRIDGLAALVEQSSERKSLAQARAERLADALVPFSFLAFFGILAATRSLATAMTVLMVDYSCAVRVATPVCVMAALAQASDQNAIIKGGKFLEALSQADTIVFDKTGTLTHASPSVGKIISFGDMDETEIIRYAACIEEHFPHSVARAIVAKADAMGLDHRSELHAEAQYIVAHGIKTVVDGRVACVGSWHFVFEDEKVKKPRNLMKKIREEVGASSAIYLTLDGKLQGIICIDDPVREEAAAVIERLRASGVKHIVMLTGDAETSARTVAEDLGIDEYHSQVLPEQKSIFVQQLRDEGHIVAMVGDGINDSPALAAANVSIALSDASDIARAVADVSIQDASLATVADVRELAQASMRRIRSTYRFIVGFNTSLIVLGVAGVLPVTTAAFLHNASTYATAIASARSYRLPERACDGTEILESEV